MGEIAETRRREGEEKKREGKYDWILDKINQLRSLLRAIAVVVIPMGSLAT